MLIWSAILAVLVAGCGERLVDNEAATSSVIAVPDIGFARAGFVRGALGQQLVVQDIYGGYARLYSAAEPTEPEQAAHWVSAPVGPAGVTLETIHALVDDEGIYHMAALDRSFADVYYGSGTSQAIAWRNLYPGYDVATAIAPIVVDPGGSIWIFFANQTSATVEALHLRQDASVERTVVAYGSATALAGGFDAGGRGYVVWAGPTAVHVSVRGDAGWQTGVLWQGSADSIDFVAQATVADIFLSYPRAVWHDSAHDDLVYAEQVSSSGWQVQAVDSAGHVGMDPHLLADANGRSWVVHTDRNELNLRGSRQGEQTGWYSRVLDSSGATGMWPDLAVDSDGSVRVVYFRADNRTIVVRAWGQYD